MAARKDPSTNSFRPRKPKPECLIIQSVRRWLPLLQDASPDMLESLIAQAPTRYTIYEPLVVLPHGSFNSPVWTAVLSRSTTDSDLTRRLWEDILQRLSKSRGRPLTHLAVNEGIPPVQVHKDESRVPVANIIRAPGALRILLGDFGPAEATVNPSEDDFMHALWVTTKQVGFQQTWAPRWTMFSRGNVKEKERILTFHTNPATEARGKMSFATRSDVWTVDMYAGIGYFTFAYAKQGSRVLCWELNPWSVEALRRGAKANGWAVRVVKGAALSIPTPELVDDHAQIVVFNEDNNKAAGRLQELRDAGRQLSILHVNCGLLPTSELARKPSWDMTAPNKAPACWLHLHENVGACDIVRRRSEIEAQFEGWAAADPCSSGGKRSVSVEHVEKVKTFAPGVWHCVFDVYITNTDST